MMAVDADGRGRLATATMAVRMSCVSTTTPMAKVIVWWMRVFVGTTVRTTMANMGIWMCITRIGAM